jgi:hypothetical protein
MQPPTPSCPHATVLVDYDHPSGLIPNVSIADLRASDPASTRERMTLCRPRCRDCGVPLSRAQLGSRIQPAGDLYDRRFLWP